MVLDGPMYQKRINIDKFTPQYIKNDQYKQTFWYMNIHSLSLVEK